MKKFAKMSLVAAVAVAGLSSTVAAKPLADAIQGVDVSGQVRYRLNHGEAKNSEKNEYRLDVQFKSKVNDAVTATIYSSSKNSTTDTTGDADPVAANITMANFTIQAGGATIIAGKQALPTPFADGSGEIGGGQQGTGAVVLYPVNAGLTLAAGHFMNTDAQAGMTGGTVATAAGTKTADLNGHDIDAIAAIGAVGGVNYAVWYAQVAEDASAPQDTNTTGDNTISINGAGATATNINVSGAVGPVNVEVNIANVNYTGTTGDSLPDQAQSRVVVSGKTGNVTLAAGMVMAGKDGADVTLGDADASANFAMEAFDATILKDTTAYYLMASMPVGPVTAKVEYGTASEATGKGTADASETKLSVSYAMSANFKISAWMTSCSDALDTKDATRLEVKYTF